MSLLRSRYRFAAKNGPKTLHLELTNQCNMSCRMCPNSSMKREKGVMSEEVFDDFCKHFMAEQVVDKIIVCGVGDPLLHPLFEKFIPSIRLFTKKMILFTNGLELIGTNVNSILNQFDEIYISINASNSHDFSRITGCDEKDFDRIVSHIETLAIERQKIKSKARIILRLTSWNDDLCASEIVKKRLKKSFGQFVDKIELQKGFSWGGVRINPLTFADQSLCCMDFPCDLIFNVLEVRWDGSIALCCQDAEGIFKNLNIRDGKMMSLWHRDELNEVRRWHLDGKISNGILCKNCVRYF